MKAVQLILITTSLLISNIFAGDKLELFQVKVEIASLNRDIVGIHDKVVELVSKDQPEYLAFADIEGNNYNFTVDNIRTNIYKTTHKLAFLLPNVPVINQQQKIDFCLNFLNERELGHREHTSCNISINAIKTVDLASTPLTLWFRYDGDANNPENIEIDPSIPYKSENQIDIRELSAWGGTTSEISLLRKVIKYSTPPAHDIVGFDDRMISKQVRLEIEYFENYNSVAPKLFLMVLHSKHSKYMM